jgi:ADP-ribose pyrophosphatase YjhB (NUDIX family)
MSKIRPIAVALIRRGDALLVGAVPDPVKGVTGWRPLGGGLELGETSREALARELREELDAELGDARLLVTLENVFTFMGVLHHEIVFVYEATLADERLLSQDELPGRDDDGPFMARWIPLAVFEAGEALLYPEGLLDALRTRQR